jgi:hypothetical protein
MPREGGIGPSSQTEFYEEMELRQDFQDCQDQQDRAEPNFPIPVGSLIERNCLGNSTMKIL